MYSLSKSYSVFRKHLDLLRNYGNRLSPKDRNKLRESLTRLQEFLVAKDTKQSESLAKEVECIGKKFSWHCKLFKAVKENILSLAVALIVAVIIRQTIFELYEIPSGSMRPTFKEKDRLMVSKSQFGINIPLSTSHMMFNQDEIKRMGIVVFTSQNMDIRNINVNYFYLFPGYKQFIKRMIGLPKDILYFYGGKIYGINENNEDITDQLQPHELDHLEYIPFILLEGRITDKNGQLSVCQMNKPIAKINKEFGIYSAELNQPKDICDLWGMGNYSSVRLVKKIHAPKDLPPASHYLEIFHHASVSKKNMVKNKAVDVETSYIPLEPKHLKQIWDSIYTARFSVQNRTAHRYGREGDTEYTLPKLRGEIPDSTYEFENGKLFKIGTQGLSTEQDIDHPLSKYNLHNLFVLFNAGIEFDVRVLPHNTDQKLSTSRYCYFRDGDFYVMGKKLMESKDKTLQEFVKKEQDKSSLDSSYKPFVDQGPPLMENGLLDIKKIKEFGLQIPKDSYLVFGDNHAMSGDSREFGFVPKENIRGVPSLLIWAPGGRVGNPNHGVYNNLTKPRITIWVVTSFALLLYLYHRKKKNRLPFDIP